MKAYLVSNQNFKLNRPFFLFTDYERAKRRAKKIKMDVFEVVIKKCNKK